MHISVIYTHIRIHIHILNFTNTQTYIHTAIHGCIHACIRTYMGDMCMPADVISSHELQVCMFRYAHRHKI